MVLPRSIPEQMAADIFAAGVNTKTLDENGRDTVFIAMGNGNQKIANVLSHGKYNHVNRDRYGETPVFTAARNEDLETVKMLQEQGYDLNAQNLTGRTPLFIATEKGCSAVVDYLLAHGGSALETDADCCTLIHNTVQKGSIISLSSSLREWARCECTRYQRKGTPPSRGDGLVSINPNERQS
jgi:ankyrin repeat protein